MFQGCTGDQLQFTLVNCDFDEISAGSIICQTGGSPQPTGAIVAEISVQNLLEEQPFIMKGNLVVILLTIRELQSIDSPGKQKF